MHLETYTYARHIEYSTIQEFHSFLFCRWFVVSWRGYVAWSLLGVQGLANISHVVQLYAFPFLDSVTSNVSFVFTEIWCVLGKKMEKHGQYGQDGPIYLIVRSSFSS